MRLALLLLIAACSPDPAPAPPVQKIDAGPAAGSNVPVCDISALPGALDDERCMNRLTESNLRYKHGVLGTRLERMKGPAVAGLRARHIAWSLSFEAEDDEKTLAALELYEMAVEMAIIDRGGPRWDNNPDENGSPVVIDPAATAEATDKTDDGLGVAPLPDKSVPANEAKNDADKKPKKAGEYQTLYRRVGRALKAAKLGKADRLVMAFNSLKYKAGLSDVKVRHSYIATLKTIERQLKARKK